MLRLDSRDISNQLVVLGSGTSVGVPMIGCGCRVCTSPNPRDRRTRCSVVVGLPEGNLLIDTSPDLRHQLLREQIGIIHAVVYTHEHADHIFGLDDLRLFQFYLGRPVPMFCEEAVELRIRKAFDYAFDDGEPTHSGAAPKLDVQRIGTEPFQVLGETITPIRLKHGPRFDVLGFRIRDVAYCTDTNAIPDESWPLLQGLDVLILDALRPRNHITHFSLPEAIEVAHALRARRTYFTHLAHDLLHEETNQSLPSAMQLAYDGLTILL
jgi:phosphoribosyl 1,2-cyclic phosphate phosphodiesterase